MTITDELTYTIRPAAADDAERLGEIFYDAFESIADAHSFPNEPGSREFTQWKVASMLAADGPAALVAERAGAVLGSAFIDERDAVAGIGPVTVAPAAQDAGVGRALMEAALARQADRRAHAIRLVQTSYHYRSLSLYAKLGFVVREPLSVLNGPPVSSSIPGIGVRPARPEDIPMCNELCARVHGHDRGGELAEAVAFGTARVAERPERISGYATGFGYGWHAVAETDEDLIALLGSADSFIGLGILVPSRNAPLLRWCLDNGLRLVQQSNLMTIGLYNEPSGAYLPSIVY